MLGKGKSPASAKWSMQDRLLVMAALQLKDELCPDCGTPIWLGHTYSSSVEYSIEYSICHACEELELQTKDLKLAPGERPHVHAIGLENEDGTFDALPSREEGYSKIDKPIHSTDD